MPSIPMFAIWNDKLGNAVSDADVTIRLLAATPVMGEKIWTGATAGVNYTQFEQVVHQVDVVPGMSLQG